MSALESLDHKLKEAREFQRNGRIAEAEQLFIALIKEHPENNEARYSLGILYLQTRNFSVAHHLLTTVAKAEPDNAMAMLALARVSRILGKLEDSLQHIRQVEHLGQEIPQTQFEKGLTLRAMQRYKEAIPAFEAALQKMPGHLHLMYNLAYCYQVSGQPEHAQLTYEKVIEVQPNHVGANYLSGTILSQTGKNKEAILRFDHVLRLDPEFGPAVFDRARAKLNLCDWSNYDQEREQYIQALKKQVEQTEIDQKIPMLDLHYFHVSPELHAKAARYCATQVERNVAEQTLLVAERTQKEVLHVGYISPDFREHPVGWTIHELFQYHDRKRFKVFCYSLTHAGPDDEVRDAIELDCDVYRNLQDTPFFDAAQQIRADDIDILVDLGGYTKGSRPEILAHKPARIQAHYYGYLDTMGADFIDFVIADQNALTSSERASYFEHVAELPHGFMASSIEMAAEKTSRADWGLREDQFVFAAFNSTYKFEPQMFSCWMNILRKVSNGVLWIITDDPEVRANLRREAQAREVLPHRLIFAGKIPQDQFIERSRHADLFLDTLHFTAGATANNMLFAGVPVLTVEGNSYASRMGAAICRAAGLQSLVTANLEEFESLAVSLAQDGSSLQDVRKQLKKEFSQSDLRSIKHFAGNLEEIFEKMWSQYQKGDGFSDIHCQ